MKKGLTIKQAIIIAERAEAIEAAAMRIKRESVPTTQMGYKGNKMNTKLKLKFSRYGYKRVLATGEYTSGRSKQ